MEMLLSIMALGLAVGGLSLWAQAVRRRTRSPLSEYLAPSLEAQGCLLLSSDVPPLGVTGPFPQGRGCDAGGKFMITWSWQYRHVAFRDRQGNRREAWARLFFGGSRSPEIQWAPDLKEIGKAEQAGRG